MLHARCLAYKTQYHLLQPLQPGKFSLNIIHKKHSRGFKKLEVIILQVFFLFAHNIHKVIIPSETPWNKIAFANNENKKPNWFIEGQNVHRCAPTPDEKRKGNKDAASTLLSHSSPPVPIIIKIINKD